MKRFISLFLITLMLAPMLFSCSESEKKGKTLYVYNWGEYISDGSEGCLDSNKAFEDWYYKQYGERVKVVYSTFSSNEDMYAKLSSGSVSYDVVVPSDYMIERLIDEDMLAPLNYDNIPNIKNIVPEFYGPDAEFDYYDEGSVYSVPYFYGMIGIIYNTEMVDKEDLGSWELMWNKKYKGNILQFNNSRDAFGTAQYKLGIDVNSKDEKDWRRALEELRKQKDIVQGYVMDEIFNKMEGGSAAIAAYYAGDFLAMYENNDDLDFFYPKEGTNLYVDAMCIPKSSKNKALAEAYINFMLSEEPAVANALYTYYASPNKVVLESEEYKEGMNEIREDAYELMYNADALKTATPYKNLPGSQLALINNLWEELKSDIEISPLIYVLCVGIVIALASFGIFFAVRKRIRNNY
ncbi:MAG: spermidine/putrescine ABC transporter substrate-binding protein [Ruminococcaceae bacterium]|nr:spermidine/putrescine ABC transporter substrate-binding protein [Oscillospiraceae bacterium]